MSELFEEISNVVIKLKNNSYIETHDGIFYVDDMNETIHWNDDNNFEDLYHGDGCTYSCEIKNGWEQDGCSFFNADNGCGETLTYIFLSKNEVEYDDLDKMFNHDEEDDD